MNEDDILSYCVKQKVNKFDANSFEVFLSDKIEMEFHEFKKLSEGEVYNEKDAEDVFWNNITKEKLYSINNTFSLFSEETKVWNLNNFTKDDSLIHTKPSHQSLKVSTTRFMTNPFMISFKLETCSPSNLQIKEILEMHSSNTKNQNPTIPDQIGQELQV